MRTPATAAAAGDSDSSLGGASGEHRLGSSARSERPLLGPTVPLEGRTRRIHRVVMVLLIVVAAAQGAYWSVATVAWSYVDEANHVNYVDSLADGDGVPIIGVDTLSGSVLGPVKEVPTGSFRADPVAPVPTDPRWASSVVPYEAIHGPVYYALMAPFDRVGRHFGPEGALYGIRIGTALLTLLVVPLTWALARRLFGQYPLVALLAPTLLVVVNAISSGAVSNDAASMVVGSAAALVFLRALRRFDRWTWPAGAGLLFGLSLLTKSSVVVLVPLLGAAFIAALVVTRPRFAPVAAWMALFVAGTGVLLVPWLAWNHATYGEWSGSHAVIEAVGSPLLSTPPISPGVVGVHWHNVRDGTWLGPLISDTGYQRLWEIGVVVAFVAGALVCARRRRWRDLAVLCWCGVSIPVAFVVMELVFIGPFAGNGGPVGRHLLPVLPLTTVMMAASAVLVVGARWAPVLVVWFSATALWFQVPVADSFVSDTYLAGSLDGGLGPVLYLDRADREVGDARQIVIDVPCPVAAIGVGFAAAPPDSLIVHNADTATRATGVEAVAWMPTYRLAQPLPGPVTIELDGRAVRAATPSPPPSGSSVSASARFDAGDATPVVVAYCDVGSEAADRASYAHLYGIGHPPVGLAVLRAGPRVLAVLLSIAGVAVTAAAGAAAVREIRARSRTEDPRR